MFLHPMCLSGRSIIRLDSLILNFCVALVDFFLTLLRISRVIFLVMSFPSKIEFLQTPGCDFFDGYENKITEM